MKPILFLALSALVGLGACSSSNSDNGNGGGDGGGTPGCQAYCTAIMANCTSTQDDAGNPVGNQQYTNMNNCLNSCKAIPAGSSSDTTGNTLGCRTYHAGLAKMDPFTHCPHAGPGGDGTCGANCDGFC